jgi:hypothetical protein
MTILLYNSGATGEEALKNRENSFNCNDLRGLPRKRGRLLKKDGISTKYDISTKEGWFAFSGLSRPISITKNREAPV